jgi:hypothetical protein
VELNKEILRWVILIGAMPIWLPFLVTLWNDFNDALREDGGLIGQPPTPRELEIIRREKAAKPDLLINEPIVRVGDHRRPRLDARRPGAAAGAPRPPGFRGGSGG